MLRKHLLSSAMLFGLLAFSAMPAMANYVTGATVVPSCTSTSGSYTISFTTADLVVNDEYTIEWSISGLASTTINNSVTFTATSSTEPIGPYTYTFPTPPSGTFTPTGSATLIGVTQGTTWNTITTTSSPYTFTFSPSSITCPGPPPPPACQQTATNSSNFNGTSVAAGNYLWFNANLDKVSSVPSGGVTIYFTNGNISFTAGGTPYSIPVPNAQITFSTTATCSSTTFDSATNTWITTVPLSGDDEIFLTGVAYQLPGTLAAGANPVNFTGTYSTSPSAPGLSVQMEWSVAAYSSFTTNYNQLGVKAGHQTACGQNNGDHAGTPEGVNSSDIPWKDFLINGPRGGGGSNFTGSWSGQLNVQICAP